MELRTNVCEPTSNSESPIPTSTQFYCTQMKLRQPLQPSSTTYKYLSTIVYMRYSMSVDRMLSVTAFCGREQTSFELRRKLGKVDGGG
ncbi:unnamed protein product [Schistosoma mattheei]|uniref:Uncharacterized protein n=1 Tax=Schistosoma mattheei TaxID=31246 RepID=A0A183NTF6_9TREM|nr:unnamed protein product [Schistosoma mattheei]